LGIKPSRRQERWKNCGATPAQEQLSAEQAQFYETLTSAFNEVFPEQQQILASLTSEFSPILAAGPNQPGFSAAEEAAMRTQASDLTAQGAQQAAVGLGAKEATMGGSEAIPSGANLQLEAGLRSSAENENAREQGLITQENYATDRANFLNAAEALGGVAGMQNPTGFGSTATGAGSAAESTMNDIATENSAWMGPVFGMLGGMGAAALGNPNFKF
jgi:hypothetical protein